MKFVHTTISTEKYDESVEFYREVVGLRTVHELPNKQITFLSDAEGDTRIEIIRGCPPAFSGQGISIGFGHPDPVALREELIAKGFEASDLMRPNEMTVFFYVKDPNGLWVQFINM